MKLNLEILSLVFFALAITVSGCASKDPATELPPWARQSTRVVDGGYIVYVGSALDRSDERAQFKAEGLALEDLANECSVVPQGTRIEDRFIVHGSREQNAYVKLAVEFETCEQAKKTVEPEAIRKVASAAFTEQLKKYQDYSETGDFDRSKESTEITPPSEIAAAPAATSGEKGDVHFYVTRQYIAYQKQIVILAPPTAYPPQSPASQNFVAAVSPSVTQVATSEHANPDLVKRPLAWSQVVNKPHLDRPGSLSKRAARPSSVVPPAKAEKVAKRDEKKDEKKKEDKPKKGRGKKHRR